MSKKILTVGGFVLAGAAVAGVTAVAITQSGLLNPKTTPVVNSGATANPGQGFIPFVPAESPISKEIREGYKFSLIEKATTFSTDPSQAKYLLRIEDNIKDEGVIQLFDPATGETFNEMEITPGDTINIRIQMNQGYEDFTARELKLFNVNNPNISVASKQDATDKTHFTIELPTYDRTLDPETGQSWLYNGAQISIVPSFIKASIGSNGNQVDWEHGGYQDSLNGYVFNMTADIKWSEVKGKIYETFKNDDPTKPIDVYFYLNGYDLILDEDILALDIPMGWGLNIFNNKYDRPNDDGKFGEIKVPGKTAPGKSYLEINGYLALGRSVKFSKYTETHGVVFIQKDLLDPNETIASMDNDPALYFVK